MVRNGIQLDMAGEIRSSDSTSERSGDTAVSADSSSPQSRKPRSFRGDKSITKIADKVLDNVNDIEAAMDQSRSKICAKTSKTTAIVDDAKAASLKAIAVSVTDLSVYDGETLSEKIDSLINEHPVVMFNRSWCLFSIDATEFMVKQLCVSVHSLEIDTHPQGKEIIKDVIKKTGHKTTPVIFIRGEFLGGFDQVNSLYATGALQRDYLAEFSQADKCEEFINKANLSKKPLFWFPETVNAYVIRIGGILTCITSIAAAILVYWVAWGVYVAYGLAGDFLLRILGGSCLSPLGRTSCLLAQCFGNKTRVGRPKQFASLCGFLLAFLASILYAIPLYGFSLAGSIVLGILALASGLEGFLDYCLGCTIFKYGVKLGIVSK